MSEINQLINKYHSWLREKTSWREIGKWTEITAPFIDRNNDYIQIYVKKNDDGYIINDDGATIGGLQMEGCYLDSPKRKKLLKSTLAAYGVHESDGKIQIKATEDNFPLKKHSLIQAILAIGDMFYLAESHVSSLFFEDVQLWLEDNDIRYSHDISFIGHSGFARKFDFLIPKSKKAPERVIKTINNPTKNSADTIIIDWLDTKDSRSSDSIFYAFINDNERKVSGSILDAIKNYEIRPVLWSKRANAAADLAA